jgi:hypothetical protein
LTLSGTGRFSGRLNRRQQERNQNTDDGDYNQEFHERKTV